MKGSELTSRLSLCFCVNRLMLAPMCVALSSAIRRLSGPLPHVYVLHPDLTARQQDAVCAHFPNIDIRFQSIDLSPFFGFRSFHGDYTIYGKLLIPSIVQPGDDFVLFLDADVIVLTDLNALCLEDFEDTCFASVRFGPAQSSFYWPLYREVGFSPDHVVFNSGVMLFHVSRCHEFNTVERALMLGAKHPGRVTGDEPLFNILFRDATTRLPANYNLRAGPMSDISPPDLNGIVHFVGSPKPWDLFGRYLHRSFCLFEEERRQLPVSWRVIAGWPSFSEMRRTVLLSRSYLRAARINQKYRRAIAR